MMKTGALFRVLLPILFTASLSAAAEPFVWTEYAAQNNLKPDQRLATSSWTSQRCTNFKADRLPASKKCQDGTDCTDKACPDGKPCVCNNGQRDSPRNPGFTGDGKTCNTLEPCMFNKIDESRMADCLPECTTLQRTEIVQVCIIVACMRCFSACAMSVRHFRPNVCLKEKCRCEMVSITAINLTAEITKSCDYASNQRVLQCGSCFLRLCQFENRFNPTMVPCASKYYADIWPCYKDHYKQFCLLEMPVCSSFANELQTLKSLLFALLFILAF